MPEKAQDFLKTAIILALASVFAYYAKSVGEASDVISVTYVLVVVLISRMTNGYMWGILASVFGVLSANFIFTAPYFEFNFTLTGYPFTFFVMLVSSIMISTLTQKYKQQKEQAEDMARKGDVVLLEIDQRAVVALRLHAVDEGLDRDGRATIREGDRV